MSLIDWMEKCIIMNKTKISDGEGGFDVTWAEGAEIYCAIALDSSMRARIAQSEGFTNVYSIVTNANVNLEFHDVIKRVSDGKIFRITSDGSDNKSPKFSSLNMRKVSAELWRLTND